MLVWFCIRAKLRAHTLRHPCLARSSRCTEPFHSHNLLKSTSTASPRTTTLASLVKGRWIDGKAQALILLLSACDMPTIFMLQTFCRQDGGIAQQPLSPHNPFQNRTIPSPCTTFLAPLSKGSWIATRLLLIINCLALRFKYI